MKHTRAKSNTQSTKKYQNGFIPEIINLMFTAFYHYPTQSVWKKSLTAGVSLICEVEDFVHHGKKKNKEQLFYFSLKNTTGETRG